MIITLLYLFTLIWNQPRWLLSLLWYFYSAFIELRHLAYGVIWTITYIWSFLAFLVNWVTLVYEMMAYFTLLTIQSSFLHSNLHHSKMLFWVIAIYYYMMFSFCLFWEGLDMLIHSSYKFDSYRIFHTSDLFQILVLCPRRNCYFPLMLSAADVFFFQYCLWWKWALM